LIKLQGNWPYQVVAEPTRREKYYFDGWMDLMKDPKRKGDDTWRVDEDILSDYMWENLSL